METPMRHTSDALRRIRVAITIACWAVIIAISVQVFTWSLVNFTGLRYGQMAMVIPDPPPASPASPASATSPTSPTETGTDQAATVETAPASPPPLSGYDSWFRTLHQLALGIGFVGLAVLLLQMSLGVVVAVAAHSTGMGRIAVAQSWTVILFALAIPWNAMISMFPYPGMLTSYDLMCSQAEAYIAGSANAPGALMFYGQYFLLPLIGVIGIIIIWIQFRAGAQAAILPWGVNPEDVALENETAGRKAGSLHGAGRTGGALKHLANGPASSKRDPAGKKPLQGVPKPPTPEAPSAPLQIDPDENEGTVRRAI